MRLRGEVLSCLFLVTCIQSEDITNNVKELNSLNRHKRDDCDPSVSYCVNVPHEYKQKNAYAIKPLEQSGSRPAYGVNPSNSESSAYPVNPPKGQNNAYPVSPPQGQNAYPVSPPRGQSSNAYPVSPPRGQSSNVYPVSPSRGESSNAYPVNPTNSYNAYAVKGPERGSNGAYPVHSPGGQSSNAYPVNSPNSNSAYPVNIPSAQDSAYPVRPPSYGSVEPNEPHGSPAYPINNGQPQPEPNNKNDRNPQPPSNNFLPHLLSETPKPINNTDEKLNIVISRDDSVYNKGILPEALLAKEEEDCETSETKVNEQDFCKGQLIFKEEFDILNPNIWKHDIRIPNKPDYEFLSYIQSKKNTYIKDGILNMKPTLLSELHQDVVTDGSLELKDCNLAVDTGVCKKEVMNYNVLPPILSAKMRSKHSFNFQYGRVEIKAKMPKGDWIYPELWLEPKDNSYGRSYLSGRVVIALTRGNEILSGPEEESMGHQMLNAGCLYRKNEVIQQNYEKYLQKINYDGWTKEFHNYTVLWKPDAIEFFVDNEPLGKCELPNSTKRKIAPWRRGSVIAPFDKEFYISVGVGAAGVSEFPDQITNGKERSPKPWKNVGAKALGDFYEEETAWSSTWNEDSVLKIDSIHVYAL